jgi:hypothetical protein
MREPSARLGPDTPALSEMQDVVHGGGSLWRSQHVVTGTGTPLDPPPRNANPKANPDVSAAARTIKRARRA